MSGPSQLHCFGEPKGQSLTRNRPVFRIWLRLRRTSARGALPSIKIDLPSIVFEMSTRRWARVPPKLEPLPPDHQVLSLRDLKHSDTVLGISKVGQKIAISVECLMNMWFCSYVICLLRDQLIMERLSKAMGAALVSNNFLPIPSKISFHMKTKNDSLASCSCLIPTKH